MCLYYSSYLYPYLSLSAEAGWSDHSPSALSHSLAMRPILFGHLELALELPACQAEAGSEEQP